MIRRAAATLAGLALLIVGAALAEPAPAPASLYAKPGRLIAVQGARRLNLVCLGQGAPTVILEAGLGDSSSTWAPVQSAIAQVTEVCAYDRAGYGFSDPARRPSDASNTADDLQRLILAAGIKTPIVLVGHSLGGLYATLFAARHRGEIAGLVLIDPSFAEQNREIYLLSTPGQRAGSDARLRGFIALGQRCMDLARRGRLAETTAAPAGCLPTLPDPDLTAIARRQYARAQTQSANLSEILSISSFKPDKASADSRAIDRADLDFGALPMIVLTRGDPAPAPAFLDAETQGRINEAWKRGHDRLAAYSTIGQSIVVPGADHYIQRDQPAAVIDAVTEVVKAVRASH